jgi:hypothetical protein
VLNLGVVIAVSDYGSVDNNLPGCKIDGETFATIFGEDSKFDDVLVITKSTSSGSVKAQLIEFINKHKSNDIGDVVFYFTGHGDFSGDEFHFLLSDYDPKRKKQTALENTELDNLLKALNPINAVKIVDACHSGKVYIKDSDSFDKYLKSSQGEFNNCYFLFSSQVEQSSYQDEKLSFFTKSIIEAIASHTTDIIRYKDIIDFVSDSFQNNSEQTPFFVVQADFTESFCSISQSLRDKLKFVFETKKQDDDTLKSDKLKLSIVDLVKQDADKYCDVDKAMEYLSTFILNFENSNFEGEVAELYNCEVSLDVDYDCIRSSSAIGTWLDNNEHDYFAEATFNTVSRTKPLLKNTSISLPNLYNSNLIRSNDKYNIIRTPDPYSNVWSSSAGKYYAHNPIETTTVHEKKIDGFESTVEMPLSQIKIQAEPKYPNVIPAVAYIVPVISKTSLRLFFSFSHYDEKGWSDRTISKKIKWTTKEVQLKSIGELEIRDEFLNRFADFLIEPINKKFESNESQEPG